MNFEFWSEHVTPWPSRPAIGKIASRQDVINEPRDRINIIYLNWSNGWDSKPHFPLEIIFYTDIRDIVQKSGSLNRCVTKYVDNEKIGVAKVTNVEIIYL